MKNCITDVEAVEFSLVNIKKIIDFVKDSDTLYCEAYFLEKDRERAVERHHLTAKTAGRIAREAGVKNLVVMHFSPKYREFPDEPEEVEPRRLQQADPIPP